MIKTLRLKEIKLYYPQKQYDEQINLKHIEGLKGKEILPIIIDKDNFVVDGHHRYFFSIADNREFIDVIQLTVPFEETDILRDFQKHLKGWVPEDWDPRTLKKEFEQVSTWLLKNT